MLVQFGLTTKSTLLAAAAILALTAGAAAGAQHPSATFFGGEANHVVKPCAHIGGCLWDQNNSPDSYIADSQNFTSGIYPTYNDAGADDFVSYATMTVNGIDVSGQYFNDDGVSEATSANVTFYNDTVVAGVHQPGSVIAFYPNQATNESINGRGNFQIDLQVCKKVRKGLKCTPKPVKLKGNKKRPPTYWVSVVANCNFTAGCGEWGWAQRGSVINNPAVWEGGTGWGCPTTSWSLLSDPTCLGGMPDDFMFDLF